LINKKPRKCGAFCWAFRVSAFDYVFGLGTFLSIDNGELYAITFIQGPVAFTADSAIVNKHIGATFTLNEAIAFGIIEPLNGSSLAISHYYFLQLAFFYVLSRRYRWISGSKPEAGQRRPIS
jgi:hypothetical protein